MPSLYRDNLHAPVNGLARRQMHVSVSPFPLQPVRQGVGVYGERVFSVNDMHVKFRGALVLYLGKCIRVFALEGVLDVFFAENADRVMVHQIECPYVIQASRVILVIVCQEDGIDMPDSRPEHLIPEVRTCVHENGKSSVLHECRCPQALVPRVLRSASCAVATYHRLSLRGSRPQKGNAILHCTVPPLLLPSCRCSSCHPAR